MRVLISPFPLTGLDEEGGADYLPGSHARKPSRRPSSEAAGSGTARGAGEEGQEGGHGCSKEFPFSGVRRLRGGLLPENEEEKEDSLPEEGERKRKASPTGEAEGSKRGRTIPPDSSANINVGEEEWPSRARPPARS